MRWTLPSDQVPEAWFNVVPHLPGPLRPPLHPGLDGSSTGDGSTSAPQTSIITLRYGFCSNDALTM